MTRARLAFAALAATALAGALAWGLLAGAPAAKPAPDASPSVSGALWFERALDTLLQAFVLLAGALCVLLVLRVEPGGAPPD